MPLGPAKLSFPTLTAYLGEKGLQQFLECGGGGFYDQEDQMVALAKFDGALHKACQSVNPIRARKEAEAYWREGSEGLAFRLHESCTLLHLPYEVHTYYDAVQVGGKAQLHKGDAYLLCFRSPQGSEYQSLEYSEWQLISRLSRGACLADAFEGLDIDELLCGFEFWVLEGLISPDA